MLPETATPVSRNVFPLPISDTQSRSPEGSNAIPPAEAVSETARRNAPAREYSRTPEVRSTATTSPRGLSAMSTGLPAKETRVPAGSRS